jgi:DinB superfamily
MATTTSIPTDLETRILTEGYGPGAWHGADLKAALADVTPALAFWRPSPERHNIAEIAMHHAYTTHSVRSRLTGAAEPFVLEGDDWFALPADGPMTWPAIAAVVEKEQQQLASAVENIARKGAASPLSEPERFNLVLGITCHAIYHAGQVQLLKVLATGV